MIWNPAVQPFVVVRLVDTGCDLDVLYLAVVSRREFPDDARPVSHGCGPRLVRAGDWKLIEWYEDGKLELYNLKNDLGEKHDLSGREPARVKELHEMLIAFRKESGAVMPAPNPRFRPGEPEMPKRR